MNPTEQKNLIDAINEHKELADRFDKAGDHAQSAHHGSLSLIAESNLVCARAAIDVNVVSFSLFGNDPLYGETAILNADAMPAVYPGWKMRVYHDDSVPEHVLKRLVQRGVQLVNAADLGIAHWPGTFWRFAAVIEPHVARVQFRDADSIVSARESQWVQAWIDSGKPFHVLRDWYSHTDLILAGLWGAHAPLLAHMREWVEDFLKRTPNLHPTHADQHFLAQVIWPRIMPYCLTHDTVHELPFATPIDSPKLGTHSSDALGGFKAKQLTVTIPPHISRYTVTVTDEHGQIVMRYERTAAEGKDVFYMPTAYYERVESGEWKIAYVTLPNYTVEVVSNTGVSEQM